MSNIKELKKKIKTTKSTLKITSAMKLVSAAKLNRAQHAILSARPYAEELNLLIKKACTLVQNYDHPFLASREMKRTAVLIISSDRGLCAGYNSQLIKTARNLIKENQSEEFKFYFIGKKAYDVLKTEVNVGKRYTFKKSEPSFIEISDIAKELSTLFTTSEFDSVKVIYNKFKSAISFEPTTVGVLPITLSSTDSEKIKKDFPFDFKYEPDPKTILDVLIPQSYTSYVYTCLLDGLAAEHGSRMSAMDSASKNCKEAIRNLTLKMNKLRQAAITTELIEVVSGAESLNG